MAANQGKVYIPGEGWVDPSSQRAFDPKSPVWGATNAPNKVDFSKGIGQYNAITPPALQPLTLGQYGPAVDPRQFLESLGAPAMGGVQADPDSMAAQQAALGNLGRYAQGGLLPEDIARMRQVQQQQQRTNQQQNQALLGMGRRTGTAGSGALLASLLSGGQGAANQANQMGTGLVADIGNRALGAIGQQGQLAGAMRQQGFGEASQRAQAIDAINAYNNQTRNQAGQQMAGWQQETNRANVDLGNQARIYNVTQMPQQNFANQIQLANARAAALQNAAANAVASRGQTMGLIGSLGAPVLKEAAGQFLPGK